MKSCPIFERAWQAYLDGEASTPPSDQPGWSGHLVDCPGCRARDARYRALSTALISWSARPARSAQPSLSLPPSGSRHPSWPKRARPWGVAAAAAALAFSMAGPRQPAPPSVAPTLVAPRQLSESLVDAAAATIDLAVSTSRPAALLGRDLFGRVATPRPAPSMPAPALHAPDALLAFRHRIFAELRPLTDQTRAAFRFLLPGSAAAAPPTDPRRGV